jgi:hypothetical protein
VSQPQRFCVLALQEPRDDIGKLGNGEILGRVTEQQRGMMGDQLEAVLADAAMAPLGPCSSGPKDLVGSELTSVNFVM